MIEPKLYLKRWIKKKIELGIQDGYHHST